MTQPVESTSPSRGNRYRAPQDDGGILIDPPFASLLNVTKSNQRHATNANYLIAGERVADLRSSLRNYVLKATGRVAGDNASWFVSGHQPQLFHPGVWFKNHLLQRLQNTYAAVGLHVIIDNDLCNTNSIRVPTGSIKSPIIENVAYDDPCDWIPYEERTIQNRSLFESFGRRASDAVNSLIPAPLLRDQWHRAVRAADTNPNIGFAFSKLRQEIEAEWGSGTIELPLSRLCQRREFHLFVLHFIRHRSTFVEVYNRSLEEYRSINRIRSRSHPVPALSVTNEWCELPFWVWQTSRPRRQALLVRASQNGIELTDRNAVWRLPNESKTDLFLEHIAELEREGVKIRPRALMTTMFLRLLLADLFIHGIGGAKYDELTDVICDRLGIRLPSYVCATATLRLSVELPWGSASRIGELKQMLRELRFHPERFISDAGSSENQVSNWVLQKENWIRTPVLPDQRRARHEKIAEANSKMQHVLRGKFRELESELQLARADRRSIDRLGSREFSFVLFPESQLRTRMQCEFPGG